MRAIDKDAFGRYLNDFQLSHASVEQEREYAVIGTVMQMLDAMPTLDVAPVVHGRWVDMQEDDATEGMWRCSVCGSDRYFDVMTPTECGCYHCPNCGAKMDGDGNE